MKGNVLLQPNELDWTRLLDVEAKLEAEIAAEEQAARARVAAARAAAAAAVPDPQALAALCAAREQAANELQRHELDRMATASDTAVRALERAPNSLVDALARLALDAVLTDTPAAARR